MQEETIYRLVPLAESISSPFLRGKTEALTETKCCDNTTLIRKPLVDQKVLLTNPYRTAHEQVSGLGVRASLAD